MDLQLAKTSCGPANVLLATDKNTMLIYKCTSYRKKTPCGIDTGTLATHEKHHVYLIQAQCLATHEKHHVDLIHAH